MKSVIYETSGRAKEYSSLAMNLYRGCSHGCLYCYSPLVLHRDRAEFHRSGHLFAQATSDIGDTARRLQQNGEKRRVLLCFTCDPYSPEEATTQRTRQVIEILHAHGLKVTILTKGGMRAASDFDLLGPGDQFATTLTCVDDTTSRFWEPGAALPEERIESLIQAKGRDIETWVSLEPVLYPQATKQLILLTKDLVSHFKIGKLNYDPWAAKIDWPAFARQITAFMDGLGVRYYVKTDLARYLGKSEGFWSTKI